MRLLAIDPGPVESAAVEIHAEDGVPRWHAKWTNHEMLAWLDDTYATDCAIEMIASYGMAVGAEVFETAFWTGRFADRWETGPRLDPKVMARRPALLIYRREVKLHLCDSPRANDSNIRQALIDRYGPGKDRAVGLKASPGPLYGLTRDRWAALAVAVTCAETRLREAGE